MPASSRVQAKFIGRLHGELIMFVYIIQTREAADMEKYVQKQRSPKNLVCKYLLEEISAHFDTSTKHKGKPDVIGILHLRL